MITFPQSGAQAPTYDTSYRLSQRERAEMSGVTQNAQGQSTIKVSASASTATTVTLSSGAAQKSHTFLPSGVAKYEAISDAPVAARTPAASNILNFVSLRVLQDAAEGATADELASRLKAGYEGFVKGYGEAFDELSAAGLLSPEVEEAIGQTFDQVLAGIDQLAAELGVESPVADQLRAKGLDSEVADSATTVSAPMQNPASLGTLASGSVNPAPENIFASLAETIAKPANDLAQLLETSLMRYESSASRNFSFTLKTQDGDQITISADASRSVRAESAYANGQDGRELAGIRGELANASSFNLAINGELDEGELAAINDLLTQVGDLSETFFTGNIEDAFEMALNIGFDESEIARFSLNLKQEVTTRVETAYRQVQGDQGNSNAKNSVAEQVQFANKGNNSLSRLAVFIQMIEDVRNTADALGVEREVIPKFAGFLAETLNAAAESRDKLEPFLEKMVYQLPER